MVTWVTYHVMACMRLSQARRKNKSLLETALGFLEFSRVLFQLQLLYYSLEKYMSSTVMNCSDLVKYKDLDWKKATFPNCPSMQSPWLMINCFGELLAELGWKVMLRTCVLLWLSHCCFIGGKYVMFFYYFCPLNWHTFLRMCQKFVAKVSFRVWGDLFKVWMESWAWNQGVLTFPAWYSYAFT